MIASANMAETRNAYKIVLGRSDGMTTTIY
jgi:hypothetical protein